MLTWIAGVLGSGFLDGFAARELTASTVGDGLQGRALTLSG